MQNLIDTASSTLSDATGLTFAETISYFATNYVKPFIGAALAMLDELKGWILLAVVLGFAFYWIYRWLRFSPR